MRLNLEKSHCCPSHRSCSKHPTARCKHYLIDGHLTISIDQTHHGMRLLASVDLELQHNHSSRCTEEDNRSRRNRATTTHLPGYRG